MSMITRRSDCGTPRISANTCIGISDEISRTKSNRSGPDSAVSITAFATVRIWSIQTPTARGVKRLLISPRSWSWRGGSMSIIDLRASIWSGRRSSSEVPPISDENVSVSRCTWRMSS
jgi:hypothetical protein